MQSIKSYKDLKVWQKSIQIVDMVYLLTKKFPDEERFGLINQIRRSAVSISSNIAEGWGRESTKSFINYLRIARGSLFELETQILISYRQKFIRDDNYLDINELIDHESRMIKNLMKSLASNSMNELGEDEVNYNSKVDNTFSAERKPLIAEQRIQSSISSKEKNNTK